MKLTVTIYKRLYGLAPKYMVGGIKHIAGITRRDLCSSLMETMAVPYTTLATAGDGAFLSFGHFKQTQVNYFEFLNSLSYDVTVASTWFRPCTCTTVNEVDEPAML